MNRRVLVSAAAVAGVFLIAGAVLAGVLIANGSGNSDGEDKNLFSGDGPAYLGAGVQDLPFDVANLVISVDDDSPAAKTDLTFGDSLRKLDGQKVTTRADVERILATKKPGDTISMEYWRFGDTKTANVRLTRTPKNPKLTQAGEIEFGNVREANDKTVTIGLLLSTKEVSYKVAKSTRFWRGVESIKAEDLKAGDRVIVISVDGGTTALTGLAYSR